MIRYLVWIAFVCASLAYGNPKKVDFVSWFTNQAIQQGNRHFGAIGAGASALAAGPIINSGTSRKDYFFFSTFTVDKTANTFITGEASPEKTIYLGFAYLVYLKIPAGLSQNIQKFETSTERKRLAEPKGTTNQLSGGHIEKLNVLLRKNRPTCSSPVNKKEILINGLEMFVDRENRTFVYLARGARSSDILVYDLKDNSLTGVNSTYPENNLLHKIHANDADRLLQSEKSCNFSGHLTVNEFFDCSTKNGELSCEWKTK